MHINLTSTGLYALENTLRSTAERADDLSPVFQTIATKMIEHERQVFMTSGASVSRPWKVLEPETIAHKLRSGAPFPDKPLMNSLRLFNSLTVRDHPDMILEITDSFMRYGSKVPYVGFLDEGTEHMEARHPIMFTIADAREYYRDIQNYIFRNKLN